MKTFDRKFECGIEDFCFNEIPDYYLASSIQRSSFRIRDDAVVINNTTDFAEFRLFRESTNVITVVYYNFILSIKRIFHFPDHDVWVIEDCQKNNNYHYRVVTLYKGEFVWFTFNSGKQRWHPVWKPESKKIVFYAHSKTKSPGSLIKMQSLQLI